ncbi:hypothetical protein QJS10_CPA16g01655 [Acorus calamus]|uniref:Pectinesterase inhibitor domain-containing protein n=1 Tax=Acorus calamus TaxID=4465 RepID=A0AAV9D0K8_ACOCL|nr:hypothetical protein QJS10_CPA16g01655 [Acorus calamus]
MGPTLLHLLLLLPLFTPPTSAHCIPRPSSPHPLPTPPSPPPIDAAIRTICLLTDHPDLCISSTHPFHPTPSPPLPTPPSTRARSSKWRSAREASHRIASDPSTPSTLSMVISVCTESYDDALDNLKSATNAIADRDAGTLDSMLSAAMTDFGTCEDSFMETPGILSPMAKYDDTLTKLASNCLVIAKLVH